MRKLLWLIPFLIFLVGFSSTGADQPDFPNIYIDKDCAGTHVGSEANPYDDLVDVNWTTGEDNSIFDYLAGSPSASPTIHLNKGDTWREQMTVGCSGTATYPIVVMSYGSGADPIINGADLVETWIEHATETSTWAETINDYSPYALENFRVIIHAADISTSGEKVRCKFIGHNAQAFTILGASIGVRNGATDDFSAAPTRITFDTGNHTKEIGVDAEVWSDWITFDLNEAVDHLVHVYKTSDVYVRGTKVSQDTYYKNEDVDYSQTQIWASDGVEWRPMFVFDIEVQIIDENIWKATLNTEPHMVFFDGIYGDKKASIGALVNEYDWYWTGNVLYCYCANDPDGEYTKIEASQRDNTIVDASHAYLTIDGLEMKYPQEHGVLFYGNNYGNVVIQNCTLTNIGAAGITIEDGDVDINNNTLSHIARREIPGDIQGIMLTGLDGGSVSGTVSDNTISYVYGDTGQGIVVANLCTNITISGNTISHAYDDGIKVYKVDGLIIENNKVHDFGDSLSGWNKGIGLGAGSGQTIENVIIRYNKIYDGQGAGIYISPAEGTLGSVEVYYNLVYNNMLDANNTTDPGQVVINADTAKVYNNIIYNSGNIGLYLHADFTNGLVKNNIIRDSTGVDLHVAGAITGTALDYNCYYRPSGNLINYDEDTYTVATFGDYQSEKSQDANSIAADPLMIDPANDNFKLNPHSPCINKGTDVSLTEDYEGLKIRHAPDIGAHENQTNVLFFSWFLRDFLGVNK